MSVCWLAGAFPCSREGRDPALWSSPALSGEALLPPPNSARVGGQCPQKAGRPLPQQRHKDAPEATLLLKNETQCEPQSWRPKEAIGLLQMATSDSPSSNHATCRVSTESWLHLVSVLGAPPPCRGAGTLCVRGTAEAGEAYLEPTELGGPQSRGARSWSPPPPTCHAPCQLCPHCPGSLASETTPLDGPGQQWCQARAMPAPLCSSCTMGTAGTSSPLQTMGSGQVFLSLASPVPGAVLAEKGIRVCAEGPCPGSHFHLVTNTLPLLGPDASPDSHHQHQSHLWV